MYDYGLYDYGLGYSSITGVMRSIQLVSIFFSVAIFVLQAVGLWNLFKKAGRNGWEGLIPFYGTWVLGEVSGVAPWWSIIAMGASLSSFIGLGALGVLLRIASIFASFIIYYNLSKKMHKDMLTTVLLTLFDWIMLLVVGISKNYQYDASVQVSPNGPFDSSSNSVASNQSNANNNFSVNDTVANDTNTVVDNTNTSRMSSDNLAKKTDDTISNDNKNSNKKYCSSCGTELNKDAKFCVNCGKKVE